MEVNKLIKRERVKKRMTQMQLSKVLGYSTPQFVSNCERNLCTYPNSVLRIISRCLNIPLETLLIARFSDYKTKLCKIFRIKKDQIGVTL